MKSMIKLVVLATVLFAAGSQLAAVVKTAGVEFHAQRVAQIERATQ